MPFVLFAAVAFPTLARAGELTAVSVAAGRPAANDDDRHDVRVLGHLNVNKATREELLQVPGLDAVKIDALLEARKSGPVLSLAGYELDAEVVARLTTTGASTLRKIRPLPLEVFTPTLAAAR